MRTLGLGISLPGLIDPSGEEGSFSPNLRQTDNQRPGRDLGDRLKLPTLLIQENDALCLGERRAHKAGDLATIDEEGYCNIVGRVKDMLIRGGENVYPREIEEFLFRHPKVQSVQVFGVPDVKYGEEVCAWVVLKPGETSTEDEIKDFCRDQIAHYKVPRYVRFVQELPMTVTGKAQKFVMRDQMIEELKLQRAATA